MRLRAFKVAVFLISFVYCCVLYLTGQKNSENLSNENRGANARVDSVVRSRRITSLQTNHLQNNEDYYQFIQQDSIKEQQPKIHKPKVQEHDDFGRAVTLDDIFISVKTSGKFHRSRLQVILDTWFTTARRQTYFFTDTDDDHYQKLTGGNLINTGCGESHTRHDLACKMGAEYDAFRTSRKKWWCHFDDDNYVNTGRLVKMLLNYDWRKDMYIGRVSLNHPFHSLFNNSKVEFWFATGGAGLCVSSALAEKMSPWCSNGRLEETSSLLRAPDDCTLGFVINNRLGVELTHSHLLHSHLEVLGELPKVSLTKQVSLSYRLNEESSNLISLDQRYNSTFDPTLFISLHCLLSPTATICVRAS